MILTGRWIREARVLLGWRRSALAVKVGRITTLAIMRAEEAEDEERLSPEQDAAVRRTLQAAGVEFISENGGGAGVRLRKPGAPG